MVNAKRWHPKESVPSSFTKKKSTEDRPLFGICADELIPTAIVQYQPTLYFEHTYELNGPFGSSYNVVCNVFARAMTYTSHVGTYVEVMNSSYQK
jgi:hypothetical protein